MSDRYNYSEDEILETYIKIKNRNTTINELENFICELTGWSDDKLNEKTKTIENIDYGDCFKYADKFYIKLKDIVPNVIPYEVSVLDISTFEVYTIRKTLIIEPVDIHVNLKEIVLDKYVEDIIEEVNVNDLNINS